MPYQIIRDDITKVKADIIVNTANPKPIYAPGTDVAIYNAAGAEKLLAERRKIGDLDPGEIGVTPAFDLSAKYIIHAVGPTWVDGNHGEFDILRSCYAKSLMKAQELECASIAFPLMATGVNGFPKNQALQIAMSEISRFLMEQDSDMTVFLVVFDKKAFRLSQNLFFQISSFITDEEVIKAHLEEYSYDEEEFERERNVYRRETEILARNTVSHNSPSYTKPKVSGSFTVKTFNKEQFMNDGKSSSLFKDYLLKLLYEKDMDPSTVYNKVNLKKAAFSKMMTGDTKKPQKDTMIALCFGFKLNLEESKDFLASAETAFNPHDKRDQLIMQCLARQQYECYEVDEMMLACGFPTLFQYE